MPTKCSIGLTHPASQNILEQTAAVGLRLRRPMGLREAHIREHISLGAVHQVGKLRELGSELIGDDAPVRARRLEGVLRERRVDRGGTIWRCPLPAWARALRRKCTLQRCQMAASTFPAAALRPSCASEITNFTPRRPRRVRERRNSSRTAPPRIGHQGHSEHFAHALGVHGDGDNYGLGDDPSGLPRLHIGRIDPQVRPVPFDRTSKEGMNRSSISPHSRQTWLLEMPLMPMALTSSSPRISCTCLSRIGIASSVTQGSVPRD